MSRCLFTAVLFASTLTFTAVAQDGPKDAVVLIIRHAEDADTGPGISPRGQERAEAYKDYFLNFTVDSRAAGTRRRFGCERLNAKPPAAFDSRTIREGSQIENR